MSVGAPVPEARTGDSIARNSGYAFAGQMVTSLATAALTLYLVRALGPAGYGELAIVIGIGTVVLLPGDFGVSASASRFIAEHPGDRPAIGGLVRDALRLKLAASAVLSAALFGLAGPIAAAYGNASLAWPLRAIAVAVFAQSFMMFARGFFVAVQRVSVNLRIIASESLTETGASVALVLLGGGVAGAAWGRAIGYAIGGVVGVALVLRAVGRRNLRAGAPGGVRKILRYGSALFVIDGAYALLAPVTALLLGALVDERAVGVYSAPARVIVFLHYAGLSIATGIAPRLARGPSVEPDVHAFTSGLRWIMLIQTVLVAPTVVWAGPIADLAFGSGYEESADVLALLAPYTFLTGFAPLVSLSVNYLGAARRRIPVAVGTLALVVGLGAVLIPPLGVEGAAIATDVAYGFYVFGHLWICRRLIEIPLRPIGRDLVRSALAAAAMAGVMAAFGTDRLSAVDAILGVTLGTAIYLGVLLATRALSIGELRDARDALRRRLAGRRSGS